MSEPGSGIDYQTKETTITVIKKNRVTERHEAIIFDRAVYGGNIAREVLVHDFLSGEGANHAMGEVTEIPNKEDPSLNPAQSFFGYFKFMEYIQSHKPFHKRDFKLLRDTSQRLLLRTKLIGVDNLPMDGGDPFTGIIISDGKVSDDKPMKESHARLKKIVGATDLYCQDNVEYKGQTYNIRAPKGIDNEDFGGRLWIVEGIRKHLFNLADSSRLKNLLPFTSPYGKIEENPLIIALTRGPMRVKHFRNLLRDVYDTTNLTFNTCGKEIAGSAGVIDVRTLSIRFRSAKPRTHEAFLEIEVAPSKYDADTGHFKGLEGYMRPVLVKNVVFKDVKITR
jgi:hypothetical protein